MSQEFATKFYHSSSWQKARVAYLNSLISTSGELVTQRVTDGAARYVRESDGTTVPGASVIPPGMCERCFMLGELNAADTVHHIRHLSPENIDDVEVTLGFSNLMRVCQGCHAALHSGKSLKRYTFGADGQIERRDSEREFRERVLELTQTESERRNIHDGRRHG